MKNIQELFSKGILAAHYMDKCKFTQLQNSYFEVRLHVLQNTSVDLLIVNFPAFIKTREIFHSTS